MSFRTNRWWDKFFEKLFFLENNLQPQKTKSNLCLYELTDDETNYDSQTQGTELNEPEKTSKRKSNTEISANVANVLTTITSRLACLNKKNRLSDQMHVQKTRSDDEVFCNTICRLLGEIQPSVKKVMLKLDSKPATSINQC